MLRDISSWEHIGYGGKGTLEKEELESPDGSKYIIKYPRKGGSWEDITEYIAARIGTLYGLEMMQVEIVIRNGRRGCLLRNFVDEYKAKINEEGGVLLRSLVNGYNELQKSSLTSIELIEEGFKVISQFEYWNIIKEQFIDMLIFDILIGNQDRHPFNWMMLFFDNGVMFSPIYDNGASLGFRFDDEKLMEMTSNTIKLNRYVRRTTAKVGLFEEKNVKGRELLTYLNVNFPIEFMGSVENLQNFDIDTYIHFIESLDLLSDAQKTWLKLIVLYRREKILEWIEEEVAGNE